MSEVPGWYGRAASVIAVVLSVWVGMHYRTPEWLPIYGAAAVVTALLPAHRAIGGIGIAVGIGLAVGGFYLTRGSAIDLRAVTTAAGAPAREVLAIAVTAAWLVVGSAFRLLRP
jgi:hypothetical protein